MKELEFPFDSNYIIRNIRKIRKELLSDGSVRIKKKIAVLGGSTTDHIVKTMELFLLAYGIEPVFYQSEYNKYYEDAVFGSEELDAFSPDVIFIHTTSRNLTMMPDKITASIQEAEDRLQKQFEHFRQVWDAISRRYACPVIQNNFELPLFRHSGSYDGWSCGGRGAFIDRMNVMLSDYARTHKNFYINDIHYLSAAVGLEKWHDTEAWYLYKYAMSLSVVPDLAYSVSNIIKSMFGRNHKIIDLDLDNTLWGGVIGDDGQDGIELGPETALGMAYSEFQTFIKGYKDMGVLLAVCSKNEPENALLGLKHPCSLLSPEDFVSLKANWENKDKNILDSSRELALLPESFVFIDDNPAECAIVRSQLKDVRVIQMDSVSDAMYKLSRGGFFEVTDISEDDARRSEMYAANAKREAAARDFADYRDYLLSLEMTAVIRGFEPVYIPRITQLTNKSNQFNLTTRRYTEAEISAVADDPSYISIYGKLTDKFGDNGIVSVVIGKIKGTELHIELWLMSCRVLKRDMEYAMLDELVKCAKAHGIDTVYGYYYKTQKNKMVADLYALFGFDMINSSDNGDTVWRLDIKEYKNKNSVINIITEE